MPDQSTIQPATPSPTGDELHERIVKHLRDLEARTNVVRMDVRGTKTTQGGRPVQLFKCPACPMVFGMSGHDAGEVDCPQCGVRCQVRPD